MKQSTNYVSKEPDSSGRIPWTDEENEIWHDLVERQFRLLPGRACSEYMNGIDMLNMSLDRIPQLSELNAVLERETGWNVARVPALIPFDEFFRLLSNKQFPAATFIRRREDFDYLQEPDIFHEVFGHCPLLTNPDFAHFTHTYGKLGYAADKKERAFLARLYWFTVEFGLVRQEGDLRIYGGGILSSPGETQYALESEKPDRYPLAPLDALRTPYRIDIMQPVYYILDEFKGLFDLAESDIMGLVKQAQELGLYDAKFPPKQKAS